MPGTEELVDDFDDGVIDATLWFNKFDDGVTPLAEVGGRARIPCKTSYAAFSSELVYTIDESHVHVQLFPPADGGATAEAWIQVLVKKNTEGEATQGVDLCIEVNNAVDPPHIAFLNREGYYDAAGVYDEYDPVADAWVRIRETGGNTYFETSPNGVIWTTRRTVASPAWVTDPDLEVQFIAHRDGGTDDFAYLDNVNVPGSRVKVWEGDIWVTRPMKVWDGAQWVPKTMKIYNGTSWS